MSRKRVIELIRVSTEAQSGDDRASIPAQRAVNKRTATNYGLEVVRSIEVSDVSGAAVLYAPEIQELMRLIADNEIHGVVAREFSRLMRPENFGDYVLLQAFAESNTILYLPDGPIDFSSKTGRLMGTIRAAIAGAERLEILERVWSAKEEKRKAGKLGVSRICLPYGVGYDDAKGWFYTSDAQKVKLAFEHVLTGSTNYTEIARLLGVSISGVPLILTNPIYTGWRVIDKKRDMSAGAKRIKKDGKQGDRRKMMRSSDEVIKVKVIDEPLIDDDAFTQVRQIVELKKTRHWKADKNFQHKFTYNGFLTCGLCNRLVHTVTPKCGYYLCSSQRTMRKGAADRCTAPYMRQDTLDECLDEMFGERLTNHALIYEIADAMKQRAGNGEQARRVAMLESQIVDLQAKRQRVIDTFVDGAISKTDRDSRLARLDQTLNVYQELLLKEAPAPAIDADTLNAMFSVFTEWEAFNREEKRRVLSILVPEIRVSDYRVHGLTVSVPGSGNTSLTRKGKATTIYLPLNWELIQTPKYLQ